MELFYILIGVSVTQIYAFAKTYQILYLRFEQNLYKFYLKKNEPKQIVITPVIIYHA